MTFVLTDAAFSLHKPIGEKRSVKRQGSVITTTMRFLGIEDVQSYLCSGQYGCIVSRSSMKPLLHNLLKISCTISVCCAVGVRPKMSKSIRNQS